MTKKIAAAALTAVLALGAVACSGGGETEGGTSEAPTAAASE